MPYPNVNEVESAIQRVALSNPGVTALIDLPHRTWEGRTSRAIRGHTTRVYGRYTSGPGSTSTP